MKSTVNLFHHSDEELRPFEAGQVIFAQGDSGAEMFVVVEGEVDFVCSGKPLLTVKPGEIFCEMALIDVSPHSATTRAKTACKLAAIDEKHFQFLVNMTHYFSLQVMRILVDRLRSLGDYVTSKQD